MRRKINLGRAAEGRDDISVRTEIVQKEPQHRSHTGQCHSSDSHSFTGALASAASAQAMATRTSETLGAERLDCVVNLESRGMLVNCNIRFKLNLPAEIIQFPAEISFPLKHHSFPLNIGLPLKTEFPAENI